MKSKLLMLAGCIFAGSVMADTTLVYQNKKGKELSRMMLTDGKVKMVNSEDSDTEMIFEANNTAFTIINHSEKSVMRFGEKEIEALGDVSKMMEKMINEQLSQMPAAQREQMRGMIENMIKSRMPKQAAVPNYTKNGQSDSHNGYSCEVVVKESKGKDDDHFCVTSYSNLGISSAEYSAIASFMKVAEKLASQFGQDQSMNFEAIGQVLPVYYEMESQKGYLSSVEQGDLPDAAFMIPKGYKEQSLPKELF